MPSCNPNEVEAQKFKVISDYLVSSKPAWAIGDSATTTASPYRNLPTTKAGGASCVSPRGSETRQLEAVTLRTLGAYWHPACVF